MLFDEPVLQHRGITVFRDFTNPQAYYYLPAETPRIARTSADGESGDYAMRLVLYRPDPNAPPPAGFEQGGGFLNLDCDLHVPAAVLEDVKRELRRRFGVDASLMPVPFLDGTVELILLGVGRGDDTTTFVRKVAGTTVPSLFGDERAAFSVVLDRDGAALMRAVVEAGGATMAMANYGLTYAGIGPAYNLKITIDYQSVYEHLDLRVRARLETGSSNTTRTPAGASGTGAGTGAGTGSSGNSGRETNNTSTSGFVAAADFHLLMEELKERRSIIVEEVDPDPSEESRSANQETINTIIGNLMGSTWFRPTLAPNSQLTNLTSATNTAGSNTTGTTNTAGTNTAGTNTGTTNTAGTNTGTTNTGTTNTGTTATTTTTTTAGARPNATYEGPTDLPGGLGVERFQPAATGNRETLVVRGTPSAITVGGQTRTLENGRLTVDLAEGETKDIVITWPAGPGATTRDTFYLYFNNDHPTAGEIASYSSGTPSPADARFSSSSKASGSPTPGAPAALMAWLDTLSGTALEVHAHASHDPNPTLPRPPTDPDRVTADQELSQRRLQVARALVPSRFTFNGGGQAHGHTQSQAGSVTTLTAGGGAIDPSNGGHIEHRVVLIAGDRPGAAGTPTTLNGRLARGRATTPGQPGQPGQPRQPAGSTTSNSNVQASFEINFEMIQRTEKIVATYELNSRKARKHEIHPQGQLVLEGHDPGRYILEADGAIEFFQRVALEASTTAMWEQDGIGAIQVQIRYAPTEDGGFKHTGEMFLRPDKPTDTFLRNLERDGSQPGQPWVYWYDYRVTIHYLDDVALGDSLGAVTSVGAPGADAEGWIRTFARNLVIHPRDVTPALTVNLTTGIMHFELVERVQLVVTYGPHRQNLTFTAEQTTHRLVIRPEAGLGDAEVETSGVLFYRDGAQVPLASQRWAPQELVVINEPRGNTLRVQVLLADPAHEYQSAQVRLRYVHGNRSIEDAFELREHAQSHEWAVRLEDPDARAWQWQATMIESSGAIRTIDWTDGVDERLILGVQAIDVIPVTVTWLVPPPTGGLLAVKIELEYVDASNDVRWEHSELIREGHAGSFTWSIAIKDRNARSYRYRVTEFRATGPTEGPWLEATTTALVLLPSA